MKTCENVFSRPLTKAISETFKLSIKKIYLWQKRREETGGIKPASGYQTGHRSKIKDINSFSKFIEDNQDITVNKIIEKFGKMCKNTAYNYLKKLAIHIKETFLYQERNEEKRKEFTEKIAMIKEKNLVFIDESGIDDNEFMHMAGRQKARDYLLRSLRLRIKGSA